MHHTSTIMKEMPTYGSRPLLVLTDDFDKYVIKHGKGHQIPIDILNEFICTFLLGHWNIDTPKSALVHTDQDLITNWGSNHHKVRFYNVPSFGSEYDSVTTDLSAFGLTLDSRHDYNRLSDPIQFLRIGLFDTWVENLDRHGGNYNLLVNQIAGKFSFIPIDHAFVFDQQSYSDLNPENFNPSSNMHLFDSEVGKFIRRHTLLDDNFYTSEEQYFYICIEKCKNSLNVFLNWLSEEYNLSIDLFDPLKAYLFDSGRNGQVFDEYKYRLTQ